MAHPLRSSVREHRPGYCYLSRIEIPVTLSTALVSMTEDYRAQVQAALPPGSVARVALADVVRVLLNHGVENGLPGSTSSRQRPSTKPTATKPALVASTADPMIAITPPNLPLHERASMPIKNSTFRSVSSPIESSFVRLR